MVQPFGLDCIHRLTKKKRLLPRESSAKCEVISSSLILTLRGVRDPVKACMGCLTSPVRDDESRLFNKVVWLRAACFYRLGLTLGEERGDLLLMDVEQGSERTTSLRAGTV